VDLRPWPGDFVQKKAGVGCPQCDFGRVDETAHGVRFFVADPAPSMPLPAESWTGARTLDGSELDRQLGALRAALTT
jgi:hypothetical protein